MGSEFTFHDYVNELGTNEIRAWLETLETKPRARFKKWLLHLEGTPPGQWTRPYVDTLTDHCQGLFEIRVPLDRQYRLLGAHENRTPTLLHGFVKPGDAVDEAECDRAFVKLERIHQDPDRHRAEHSYDD